MENPASECYGMDMQQVPASLKVQAMPEPSAKRGLEFNQGKSA
jgi:hypothetical protein